MSLFIYKILFQFYNARMFFERCVIFALNLVIDFWKWGLYWYLLRNLRGRSHMIREVSLKSRTIKKIGHFLYLQCPFVSMIHMKVIIPWNEQDRFHYFHTIGKAGRYDNVNWIAYFGDIDEFLGVTTLVWKELIRER